MSDDGTAATATASTPGQDIDDATLRVSSMRILRSKKEAPGNALTLLAPPPSGHQSLSKSLPGTPESAITLMPTLCDAPSESDLLPSVDAVEPRRSESACSLAAPSLVSGEEPIRTGDYDVGSARTSYDSERLDTMQGGVESSPETPVAAPSRQKKSPRRTPRSPPAAAKASQSLADAIAGLSSPPAVLQRKSSLRPRPSLASLDSIPERGTKRTPPLVSTSALAGPAMSRTASASPSSSMAPSSTSADMDGFTFHSIYSSSSSRNSVSLPGSSSIGDYTARTSIASSSAHTADTDYSLISETKGDDSSSPDDVGLGISADHAVFSDAMESSPAHPGRVRSRSRSSSAAAERARWSMASRWTSSRTSSVLGDKIIRTVPGGDVTDHFVPGDTTHLILAGAESGIEALLDRVLPTLVDTLLVLDLSRTGLTNVPEVVWQCTLLQELALSGNPLATGSLPPHLAKLRHLRLLAADGCQLHALPNELASLNALHTLSIRWNTFRSLPAVICQLGALESLQVEGNCFVPHWQALLQPIMSTSLSRGFIASPLPPASASSYATFDERPSPIDPYMHAPPVPPRRIRTSNPGHPSLATHAPLVDSSFVKRMKSTGDLRSNTHYPSMASTIMHPSTISHSTESSHGSFLETASSPISVVGFSAGMAPMLASPDMRHEATDAAIIEPGTSSGKKKGFFGSLRKTSVSKSRDGARPPLAETRSASMPEAQSTVSLSRSSRFAASMRRNKTSGPTPVEAVSPPLSMSPSPPARTAPTEYTSALYPSPVVSRSSSRSSRKSFLKLDDIPSAALTSVIAVGEDEREVLGDEALPSPAVYDAKAGLRMVMAYLRDLDDLGPSASTSDLKAPSRKGSRPSSSASATAPSSRASTPSRQSDAVSTLSASTSAAHSSSMQSYFGARGALDGSAAMADAEPASAIEVIKLKNDPVKRSRVLMEIISTEESYLRGLTELITIYVEPAAVITSGEPAVPLSERRAVFSNVENLVQFHRAVFLPDLLVAARPMEASAAPDDAQTREAAEAVASVFVKHAAFFRMYATYISGFDSALARFSNWTAAETATQAGLIDNSVTVALQPSQRKRIKTYLKQCKSHPKHSQINCESYLLLPVQRIPRYKMLLESLLACTPADDLPDMPLTPSPTLATAFTLASALASDMNERKRETDGRRKLLAWQGRIGTTRFRSPLVQPHRTLIREGPMLLSRVVKRATAYAESSTTDGIRGDPHPTLVQVPSLQIKSEDKPLFALLCSDILVLVHDSGHMTGSVDLYTVFRPSSAHLGVKPASHFGGDKMLRIVDARAILYLQCASDTEASAWVTAINSRLTQV